jgi:hypothetical protein
MYVSRLAILPHSFHVSTNDVAVVAVTSLGVMFLQLPIGVRRRISLARPVG